MCGAEGLGNVNGVFWRDGERRAGAPAAIASGLRHIAAHEFRERPVKMLMRDPQTGMAQVTTLRQMMSYTGGGRRNTARA